MWFSRGSLRFRVWSGRPNFLWKAPIIRHLWSKSSVSRLWNCIRITRPTITRGREKDMNYTARKISESSELLVKNWLSSPLVKPQRPLEAKRSKPRIQSDLEQGRQWEYTSIQFQQWIVSMTWKRERGRGNCATTTNRPQFLSTIVWLNLEKELHEMWTGMYKRKFWLWPTKPLNLEKTIVAFEEREFQCWKLAIPGSSWLNFIVLPSSTSNCNLLER